MVLVIAGFFALALTDRRSVRESRPALRVVAVLFWLVIVLVGWAYVGYLSSGTGGGFEAAWAWVEGQTLLLRVVMWLFLLPWMAALWISQMSWEAWLRTATIAGLALLTVGLSFREFGRKT
jgi:hypothetical protein